MYIYTQAKVHKITFVFNHSQLNWIQIHLHIQHLCSTVARMYTNTHLFSTTLYNKQKIPKQPHSTDLNSNTKTLWQIYIIVLYSSIITHTSWHNRTFYCSAIGGSKLMNIISGSLSKYSDLHNVEYTLNIRILNTKLFIICRVLEYSVVCLLKVKLLANISTDKYIAKHMV